MDSSYLRLSGQYYFSPINTPQCEKAKNPNYSETTGDEEKEEIIPPPPFKMDFNQFDEEIDFLLTRASTPPLPRTTEMNIRDKKYTEIDLGSLRLGFLNDNPDSKRIAKTESGIFLLISTGEVVFFDFETSKKRVVNNIENSWSITYKNEIFVETETGTFFVLDGKTGEVHDSFCIDPPRRPSIFLGNHIVAFYEKSIKTYDLSGVECSHFPLAYDNEITIYDISEDVCCYYSKQKNSLFSMTVSGETVETKLPFDFENVFLSKDRKFLINQKNPFIQLYNLKNNKSLNFKEFTFKSTSAACITDDFLIIEKNERNLIFIDLESQAMIEYESPAPYIISMEFCSGWLIVDSIFNGVKCLNFNNGEN